MVVIGESGTCVPPRPTANRYRMPSRPRKRGALHLPFIRECVRVEFRELAVNHAAAGGRNVGVARRGIWDLCSALRRDEYPRAGACK